MGFATPYCVARRGCATRVARERGPLRWRPTRTPACMSVDAGLAALRALHVEERLPGTVYLVGAGPGDPSLLTLRAQSVLRRADVVLYDRLCGSDVLSYVRENATLVYVGKQAGYHTRTQREIHALLAAFAGVHDVVVRLKGGDPGVYGRGGEEMQYLRKRGVAVQIVPGVTAASAVAAALGFPLTQRGVADTLRFATGHTREGGQPDELRYESNATLVLYMGLAQLARILSDLHSQGLPPDTPAVAVEKGSTEEQRVVWGYTQDLALRVAAHNLHSPTLVVVGHVVAFAQGWVDIMHVAESAASPTHDDDSFGMLRHEDRALLLDSMRSTC